jgi:hypothetical protein
LFMPLSVEQKWGSHLLEMHTCMIGFSCSLSFWI